MKKLLIFSILSIFLFACGKDNFNVKNPELDIFIDLLKSGTYQDYEKDENGGNLWLSMPNFDVKDIEYIIIEASDTSHIDFYPINPISSRSPFPVGRDYFILGECLLWTVEGIRNGTGYGSLDPYLIDSLKPEEEINMGLSGEEVLEVRDLYMKWWYENKNSGWEEEDPLEDLPFHWF